MKWGKKVESTGKTEEKDGRIRNIEKIREVLRLER